jgi:hydrogenase maturation protease
VIAVIGIGNRDRGDDAAGLVVTDRLKDLVSAEVKLLQLSGDPLSAIGPLQSADTVVIVDAVGPSGHPGTVQRIVAGDEPGMAVYRGRSTHGLGAADVIGLAQALGSIPMRTVVYGIEGQDFQLGHGLTPAVEDVLPGVVARILEEVR